MHCYFPVQKSCKSFHLLVSDDYGDPIVLLAILRIASQAASVQNNDKGILPINISSMKNYASHCSDGILSFWLANGFSQKQRCQSVWKILDVVGGFLHVNAMTIM